MSLAATLMRTFNLHLPWHGPKFSLYKRLGDRLCLPAGSQVYGGIRGQYRMRLDLDRVTDRLAYLNLLNPVHIDVLKRVLEPGDVYVDAGAHVGTLLLPAAGIVGPGGRAYGFEPRPATFERLRENVALNDMPWVELHNRALLSKPGEATLHEFGDRGEGGSSLRPEAGAQVAAELPVEAVALDDVVAEPVKLLKLDVEGAEWEVLRGAEGVLFDRTPPHLMIELRPASTRGFGYEPVEMIDWLLERRPAYRIHWIRGKRTAEIDRRRLGEMFAAEPDTTRDVWLAPA